jgi:hypothetical protein
MFLVVSPKGVFGGNRAYLLLETWSCRKYSFQKVTQLSQGNNILDVPASNTGGFLSRDTRVTSAQHNRPMQQTESISTLKHLSCRRYSFKKNWILTRNHVLILLVLTQMIFFRELHVFLHLSWIGWIGVFRTKWGFVYLENYDLLKFSFQKLKQFQ